MALSSSSIVEVRSGGASTGAAYFDPSQTAGMFTDGAATSATSDSPSFTSASYTFVSGDIGYHVFIASGTDWIAGWYAISNVTAGAAILTATAGTVVSVSSSKPSSILQTVGCATTSSPTGATWSIDYSQNNSSKITFTDLISAGAGLTVSSVANPFGKQMVGNGLNITSGTNFTVARYVIASVNVSNIATVIGAGNITSGVGASGNGRLGGSVALLATTAASWVAGTTVFCTGTISPGASDTMAVNGTNSLPITIEGYKTVRGDGFNSYTAGETVVTTNFCTISYASTFRFNLTGTNYIVKALNVTATASNAAFTIAGETTCVGLKVVNASSNAAATAVTISGTRGRLIDFDLSLSSTGSTAGCLLVQGASSVFSDGRVTSAATGSSGIRVESTSARFIRTTVYKCGSIGVSNNNTLNTMDLIYCTIVGNGSDGIDVTSTNAGTLLVHGCLITDNAGWGIDSNSSNLVYVTSSRFRDNTSGNLNGTNPERLKIDWNTENAGGSETDYVSYGSNDFRLRRTSQAYSETAINVGASDRKVPPPPFTRGYRRSRLKT